MFHPDAAAEYPLLHVVSVLQFLFALAGFTFFFRAWAEESEAEPLNRENHWFRVFSFGTFLWFILEMVGVGQSTPDLGVCGIVFTAAGLCCKASQDHNSLMHWVALGAVLGVGYYIKSPLFPLGLALLFIFALFSAWRNPHQLKSHLLRFLCAAGTLFLTASPLIVAQSMRSHRLSIGDTASFNYIWFIEKIGLADLEDPARVPQAQLEHHAIVLLRDPLALEFNHFPDATYPFHYEPSYWYAGLKPKPVSSQLVASILHNGKRFALLLIVGAAPFLAGLVILFFLAHFKKADVPRTEPHWWLLAWAACACALYIPVHVEPRYVVPFVLLLLLELYRVLAGRVQHRAAAGIYLSALGCVLLYFSITLFSAAAQGSTELRSPTVPAYQLVARQLRDLGLREGDSIATVGVSQSFATYYARFDRLHVLVQIPDEKQFANISPDQMDELSTKLRAIGVRASSLPPPPDRFQTKVGYN